MNKFTKFSALLVAVVTLVSGAMLYINTASAAGTEVVLGQKYVSNTGATNALGTVIDNTVTVTVTDSAANTNSGSVQTIAAAKTVVTNITTGETVELAVVESGANTGIFAGTFSVSSSTTTGTMIKGVEGQTIKVEYTTAANLTITGMTSDSVTYVTVDATGPTISNTSPADDYASKSGSIVFQAEVTDATIGVGATAAAAKANSQIGVDGAGVVPVVAEVTTGLYRLTASVVLAAGAHAWTVDVEDDLGNYTQLTGLDFEIDTTATTLSTSGNNKVSTGDTADSATTTGAIIASSDRKAIRIGFDDKLTGASIDADGSDFRIYTAAGDLAIEKAEWFDKSAISNNVFITLVNPMAADAVPTVQIIGEIQDDAGNPTTYSAGVVATDGLKPLVVATVTGTNSSGRASSAETVTVTVTADEAVTNPVITTAAVKKVGTTATSLGSAEGANAFAIVTTGREWTYTYKFTDAADIGLYNVYISLSDAAGNTETAGHATDSSNDDAVLFEVDKAIGAVAISPASTDDTESFVNLAYTTEDNEYTTGALTHDTHTTVTVSSITVDDVATTINTIDNVTFTLAAPTGGWSVGDHTVVVTAADGTGNTSTETKTFTVTTRAALSIALKPGFNLISLSGEPTSSAINDVIASTHPINMVMTYDPAAAGGWLVAERNPDNGNAFEGTLTTIDSSRAYLVRTTTFQALEVLIPRVKLAERALPRTVSLGAGWNFVPVIDLSGDLAAGASTATSTYFASVSADSILGIDSTGKLAPVTTVKVGEGYLVHMSAADVLVPAH